MEGKDKLVAAAAKVLENMQINLSPVLFGEVCGVIVDALLAPELRLDLKSVIEAQEAAEKAERSKKKA